MGTCKDAYMNVTARARCWDHTHGILPHYVWGGWSMKKVPVWQVHLEPTSQLCGPHVPIPGELVTLTTSNGLTREQVRQHLPLREGRRPEAEEADQD
jgi:hypothetical protein